MESAGELTVQVFDAAGRVAYSRNWDFVNQGAFTTELSANDLSAGVHTVIFTTENTRSIKRVVVVK
jgi:PKD repeat protein